jgi:hypothetical protein
MKTDQEFIKEMLLCMQCSNESFKGIAPALVFAIDRQGAEDSFIGNMDFVLGINGFANHVEDFVFKFTMSMSSILEYVNSKKLENRFIKLSAGYRKDITILDKKEMDRILKIMDEAIDVVKSLLINH